MYVLQVTMKNRESSVAHFYRKPSSAKQSTVKRMKFLVPLLFVVAVTVSASDNSGLSAECLKDLPTVSKIGNLADGHTNTNYCTERTSSMEIDDTGVTSETEVTMCDATGTEDALSIIQRCHSVGGKDITVLYSQQCNLVDMVNNRKDIVGPLCVPKSCPGDAIIHYFNAQEGDGLALDFGDKGGCTRKIISMNA